MFFFLPLEEADEQVSYLETVGVTDFPGCRATAPPPPTWLSSIFYVDIAGEIG